MQIQSPYVEVEFSCEDGTRTQREFLYKILEKAIDAGSDVVNIPDTVGYSTPIEFGYFIAESKSMCQILIKRKSVSTVTTIWDSPLQIPLQVLKMGYTN